MQNNHVFSEDKPSSAESFSPTRRRGSTAAIEIAIVLIVNTIVLILIPSKGGGRAEEWEIGYVLGSVYAHAFLASAFAVFGPGRKIWRIILSPAWILAVVLSVVLHFTIQGLPQGSLFSLCILLVAQWLVSLLILGLASVILKMRLTNPDYSSDVAADKKLRFNIRHLLIIMSVSAVLLAAGRAIIPWINMGAVRGGQEFIIFAYLSVAAVLTTLPLGLSLVTGRLVIFTFPLALSWLVLAVVIESTLFSGPSMSGPNYNHLIAINTFLGLFVIIVVGCVGVSGYRLRIASSESRNFT